jgi:hypothetical protein
MSVTIQPSDLTCEYRAVLEDGTLTIREVYYTHAGSIADWTDPVPPTGEDIHDLRQDIQEMQAALQRPILHAAEEHGVKILKEHP